MRSPEERRIQQIPFKDEAAAQAARAEIVAGKDFVEVAKANGAKETDIELGLLTRDKMIDPAIAEAAFKLDKDKVSDVVKGRFSTVLVRVTEIKAGRQRPFEEVRDEIRDAIASERVGDRILEIQNNIDDNRLAGKSLKEIGEILKLPFLDVAGADSEGKKADGKPALDTPDAATLIATAFRAEVGVENEVIELSDGGYAWLNLIAVMPEKQRPFKDVGEEVKKVWQEDETKKQLGEVTVKLAKRANEGTALAEIAKEYKTEVKTTPPPVPSNAVTACRTSRGPAWRAPFHSRPARQQMLQVRAMSRVSFSRSPRFQRRRNRPNPPLQPSAKNSKDSCALTLLRSTWSN